MNYWMAVHTQENSRMEKEMEKDHMSLKLVIELRASLSNVCLLLGW